MLIFKLIELMDKFKKIFLFLLELKEQTHVHLKSRNFKNGKHEKFHGSHQP